MKNDNSVHNRNADFIGGNHFRMRDTAEGSEQLIGMGNPDCCGLPACKQYEVKIRMTKEEAIEYGNLWLEVMTEDKGSNTYEFFKMALKALEQQAICPSAGIDCVDCPACDDAIRDVYKQGWHDAIITALKETHSVHTEEGNFRVVQEETLIGVGMAYEQASEEKKGRWIDTGSGQMCSRCGEIQYGYDSFRRFCASCGIRMVEP